MVAIQCYLLCEVKFYEKCFFYRNTSNGEFHRLIYLDKSPFDMTNMVILCFCNFNLLMQRKFILSSAPTGVLLSTASRLQSRRGPPTGGFPGGASRNPYEDFRQPQSPGRGDFNDPRARMQGGMPPGGDPRFDAMNRGMPTGNQFGRAMPDQMMQRGGQQQAMHEARGRAQPENVEPEERPPIVKPGPPQFLKIDNLAESFQTSEKAAKAYDGIVKINLSRGTTNMLNTDLLKELVSWIHYLGNEDNVKGIILSSATATAENPVFSLGLDINEFIQPQKERFEAYWNLVQEAWMLLTSFPKVLIADINGSAISGGCMLAMACDYRVMHATEKAQIGFNEVTNGLVVPPWLISHFSYLVGNRKSEILLQTGKLLSASEAKELGLVDETVDSIDACHDAAQKAAQLLLQSPDQGRWMVKDMSRRELFRFLSEEDDRRYDIEFFSKFVQHPDVQKNLQHHEMLKSQPK